MAIDLLGDKVVPDLDEIEHCLEVGRPAVLSIAARRGGDRSTRAIIRGWQRGSYVLLDIPDDSGLGVGPRVGDRCKLRFLADGDACSLDATLIDLGIGSHFSYIKIAWPHAVTLTRVRKHQRVHVHLPCSVRRDTGNPISGEIQDISAGGCRISLEKPIPQGVFITVEFQLPDVPAPINVSAEICATGMFPSAAWLGCRFVDVPDDIRYTIDFFVATTAASLRANQPRTNQVLVISPDLAQAASLKQALASQGHDVIIAPNIIDGFFWLRACSPALLLIHANPVPFRGTDVLVALRAIPAFSTTPIVLYGGPLENQKAVLDAGANQYLPAAAQVQELVTAVAAHLKPKP